MPKNPHPPRNTASSKKSATAGGGSRKSTEDGGSYIVFTNDTSNKSDAKKKNSTNTSSAGPSGDSSSKGKPSNVKGDEADPNAPKRPDVRTLIGGASWTGKLPVNMLSEHCQKQKWEKPDYSMNKAGEGQFSSIVTLSQRNPKTREVINLPSFRLPPDQKHLAFQPTAVEARHFAAAYALFRVSSDKNIHMMMPPMYRDLWKGAFREIKEADVKDGKVWMYAADPFQVQKDRESALVQKTKLREQREKQQAAEAAKPGAAARPILDGNHDRPREGPKAWNAAPKLEIGKRLRRDVEKIVRDLAVWNPHGSTLNPDERATAVAELLRLGFRKSHVEEALGVCKDREEALEWLLIHVPEDDLPSWSLPDGYVAGISMASGNLKKEACLKRLAVGGYAADLCEEMYDAAKGDEALAADMLQQRLLRIGPQTESNIINHDADNDEWKEEAGVLASIYGDRYESSENSAVRIKLEQKAESEDIFLLFQRPTGKYPDVLPVMNVSATLPAYIRLNLTLKALQHAQDQLLGEQMLFNIIDWVEQNVSDIIANPGKLAEVASAIVSSSLQAAEGRQLRRSKKRRFPKPLNWNSDSPANLALLEAWNKRQGNPAQQKMLKTRQSLPAWKLQEAIVAAVNSYQVVIISGETGSGKSTQSVQFILDDLIKRQLADCANIICTQPRRISALGLADRVADERCSHVGQEIGYAIRGESKQTAGITKVTFVTTGVLLRRLQISGGSTEDTVAALADVSHIVIDEVHERSLDTDFLLALLRGILKKRKDLKLVLMSATLDADIFETYFGGPKLVGRVEIQGRTYPVEDFFLDDVARLTNIPGIEDDDSIAQKGIGGAIRNLGMRINYDLIAQLVQSIDRELGEKEGGILVFLPGTAEINRTLDALRSIPGLHALPLHASLLPVEQRRVFPMAPRGKRKVIASTNVAETSITIEDIVAVIDTGRVKETRYDVESSMVKLEEVWASRAACKQRRGRAGRVRAGKCYKLYTRNAENKMMERPDPEIRRVPLEQLCLSVKAMGVNDVADFLASTLTPPESLAVEGALSLLRQVGALDADALTALGQHMAMIPADLRCAKLMVFGALLGYLEPAITIAAILTVRSPFVSPQDKREESKASRTSFAQGQGDVIGDLRAYDTWNSLRNSARTKEVRSWCDDNFLSVQTLNDIANTRTQYISSLQEIGFLPLAYKSRATSVEENSDLYFSPLLNALIFSALHPQSLQIQMPSQRYQSTATGAMALDPESRAIKYFSTSASADGTRARMFIHPSSTLFSAQSFRNNSGFMSYFTKVETSKVFIRECTPCGTFGALLLGSGRIELDVRGRGVVLVDKLRGSVKSGSAGDVDEAGVRVLFGGWARIGVLVSRLRAVLDEVLARWIENPSSISSSKMSGSDGALRSSEEENILEVLRRLIEFEGMDR